MDIFFWCNTEFYFLYFIQNLKIFIAINKIGLLYFTLIYIQRYNPEMLYNLLNIAQKYLVMIINLQLMIQENKYISDFHQ